MAYVPGQAVEVKVGGSLGRWASGTVVHVDGGCCGQRATYHVQVEGRAAEVSDRQLRRPRRVDAAISVPPPRSKPKRNDQVVIGRGPLRFPEFRRWVKTKPCIFCSRKADDPHHYGPKGTGQTTDDTRLTPVCRQAHDALHHRRLDELCGETLVAAEHWVQMEAYIYRRQVDLLTEYLRFHDGVMS